MKYCFGVDIGGTFIKLGLFSKDILLEKWSIPTNLSNNGSKILPEISSSILEKMNANELHSIEILGVGVGVPGPVSDDGIVQKCVNLGWDVTDVKSILGELLNLPVYVGNDANVAALGEMFKGGGIGHKNLVMITLGTGVGGGIILNGNIVNGSNGAGGEIGHLPMIDNELEACGCGNHGCLEQYASANGIVKMTQRYFKEASTSSTLTSVLKTIPDYTSEDIFNAAKAGDSVALEMVSRVCNLLGKACATISCTINPEIFVIGGGMSAAGTFLLNNIQISFQKYAFHAARNTEFSRAKLGNDAGIYGSAKMVIDTF